MQLDIKQLNNLFTGVRLVSELNSNRNDIKKFLTIRGYKYDSYNKEVEFDKFISKTKLQKVYFELKIFEISTDLDVSSWDITENDFEYEIIIRDIENIEKLECILKNYIEDYSILKPEWYFENLPFM